MNREIFGKGLLYAIPLFLTPFADRLADRLFNNVWPTIPQLVGCALLGTIAVTVGLRAFVDGSCERNKQNQQTKENHEK